MDMNVLPGRVPRLDVDTRPRGSEHLPKPPIGPSTRYVTVSMIVFARGLVVSPYARDISTMIVTNTYRPDTSSGRRILTLCCMTEEHDLSERCQVVTESRPTSNLSQTHMVSTFRPSTITPVPRSCSRPPPTPDILSTLHIVGDSLPRGLNWPIKLCRRSPSRAPAMDHMKGRRSQKLTHVRACGVHVLRMERCDGLVRHCGIQRCTWRRRPFVRTYTENFFLHT